jgi:hypothetical protein
VWFNLAAWHFSTFIVFLRTWIKLVIDSHFDSVLQTILIDLSPLRTM